MSASVNLQSIQQAAPLRGVRLGAALGDFRPAQLYGGIVPKLTFDVFDTFTASGGRATETVTMEADVTVHPYAARGSDLFLQPQIHFLGTLTFGTLTQVVLQILDSTNAQAWAVTWFAKPTQQENYYGKPIDTTPPGLPSDWQLISLTGPPILVDHTYYRLRFLTQADPTPPSDYAEFGTTKWFTLSGGFKAAGFVPP